MAATCAADLEEAVLFYLSYIFAELRRRKGRTVLTSLGLAVGVGLVATVTALSQGLDNAQDEVLKPLTGVGTDMSVSRPIRTSGTGDDQSFSAGPGGLSQEEQDQLREENGQARFGLRDRGEPGETFSDEDFVSAELSFPQAEADRVAQLDGVAAAAPSLTLNRVLVSGTVPDAPPEPGGQIAPGGGGAGGPDSIDFDQSSIAGVDTRQPDLGLVTPAQVQKGGYFSDGGTREAVLSVAYAKREKIDVGDTITVTGKKYTVVGLASAPLGGQVYDAYVPLGELQELSGREGRVNGLRVRADSSGAVDGVAERIEASFAGAQVTTAKDLADKVSGSLVDAKNLSGKLSTALAIVALVAAFLIAGLLTLSSVNKRIRELGTLKAIGWPQRLVVRQVTGESLAQGVLGGVLGAALGIGGAALITAFAPSLEATVAEAAEPAAGRGGPAAALFGSGEVQSGSNSVALEAPIDLKIVAIAIGLALLGGLVSGAIGGARAARLRPADALRSVE